MAVIRVPKTPRKAFNEDRPASRLLLDQIKHLEWAVLPASQRKPDQLPKREVRTEGQAGTRAAQLMRLLEEQRAAAASAPGSAAGATPVRLPPLPRAATERSPKAPGGARRRKPAAARGKATRRRRRARG